jgi:hypothetical protein
MVTCRAILCDWQEIGEIGEIGGGFNEGALIDWHGDYLAFTLLAWLRSRKLV